jgi:hypothetical protein
MTNFNAKDTVDSLVKIAQDMVDMTNEHAQEKASPEEVLQGLEAVISQLQAIAAAVPAENAETPGEQPPVEAQGPLAAKLAESQTKIAELETKLNANERKVIAEERASLYPDPIKAAKLDEVLKSEKTNEQLKVETDAIREFSEINETSQKSGKSNSGFQSYTKTAKQNEARLFIL